MTREAVSYVPAGRMHAFLSGAQLAAVAHRGGAGEAPENTMAAFARAADLGFRYIETDVQATRDNKVVAFHDLGLDRLTALRGPLEACDWAELKRAKVAGREAIPRLEELLEAWPDMRFIIEAKTDRVVVPLVRLIRDSQAMERICIGSFSDRRIAHLREELGPGLCTSLGRAGVARLRLASLGLRLATPTAQVTQVPVRYRGLPVVDRRFLATARRRGLAVQVWTVNQEAEMEQLIELGVDGLITDRPSLLRRVLQARGLWDA